MTDHSEYDRRRKLTFLQAEGLEGLPRQLKKTELPKVVQAKLWSIVYRSIKYYCPSMIVAGPWKVIITDFEVEMIGGMADEIRSNVTYAIPNIKHWITVSKYANFYHFVQWLVRHPKCPDLVKSDIEALLANERCAYRLIHKDTLVPFASEAEHLAIMGAISATSEAGYSGSESHLKKAIDEINAGNYADSVRESIHAVESIARGLSPETKTLGDALSALEKNSVTIHPAMKKGFAALYGYTNGEAGIRHAIIEGKDSKVDETDAMYMLGSCAAFTTYLINKSRS